MARIRTVKPELFRHEGLFEAEQETGLPLRVAFIGLFTVSDREGRFRWQPRQLKLDVMPYDPHDFSRVLDALTTRGFLVRYRCGTDEYGVIPSFTRHQVINNKEKAADFPAFEEAESIWPYENNDLSTREPRVSHASPTTLNPDQGEGKGREGEQEGKGKGNRTRGEKNAVSISAAEMIDQLPGLSIPVAEEYRAFRKSKRAPLTSGAWKTIAKEIRISGLLPDDALNTAMARGWQGFEAAWLASKNGAAPVNRQQQIEDANAAVVREIMERENRINQRHDHPGELFDIGDPIIIEGEVIHAQ